MEMKTYLKWWEITACFLPILFVILFVFMDINSIGSEKRDLDEDIANIEFQTHKISDDNIESIIYHGLLSIQYRVDNIYFSLKRYNIVLCTIFLYCGIIVMVAKNQQRKYKQTITQLEWALKEEKEKSKER